MVTVGGERGGYIVTMVPAPLLGGPGRVYSNRDIRFVTPAMHSGNG